MRGLYLAILFTGSALAQQAPNYRMSVLLPVDPMSTLGAANGLLTRTANWAQIDTIAPGSFIGVSVLSVVSSTTFAYICGMNPSNTVITLRPLDGSPVTVPLVQRPPYFGADPPAGCDFITGIVPRDFPIGPAELSFSFGNIHLTTPLRVVSTYATLFTPLDQKLSQPYLSGDTVSVRAGSLGIVPLQDVSLVVGGVRTPATAINPDPDIPGLDRVSFVMPPEAPETCYLPVYLATSTGETSAVFVPKASQPGPCRHPWGLDETTLNTLDQGGRIWLAQPAISLYARERTVTVSAAFTSANIWRAQFLASPEDTRPCRFRQGTELAVPQTVLATTFGDAGSTLSLTGPDAVSRELPSNLVTYSARFALPDSQAGIWTLTAPGGSAIGPFQASVAIPSMPAWTPPDSIDRETGIDITWDPNTVVESDRLAVVVQTAPGAYLECRAPAKSGAVTLPPRYLRNLPSNSQAAVGITISRPYDGRILFPFPTNTTAGTGVLDYQLISVTTIPVL